MTACCKCTVRHDVRASNVHCVTCVAPAAYVHNTVQSAHKLMRSNAAESMKQRNSLVLLSCAAVRQHGMCAGASQGHACDESECGRLVPTAAVKAM